MRIRCSIGANASLTIKIYRISTIIRTKHHLKCCGKVMIGFDGLSTIKIYFCIYKMKGNILIYTKNNYKVNEFVKIMNP